MSYSREDVDGASNLTCQGTSLGDVCVDAAHGLFDVLADGSKIRGDVRQEIVIQAEDTNGLLREWLKELIARVGQMGMLYSDFEVFSVQKTGAKQLLLTGAIYGEPIDKERHTVAAHGALDEKSVSCDEKADRASCSFSLSRS